MTKERILLGIEYAPAGGKGQPATVDLAWYDEEKGKNGYATLQGKAAKALSNLRPGDIYYDETED